ncbi:MAG: hypothetical protein HYW02_08065 [Deltaproteobacteria bacterium]|nr:hypothetical protein [Deltaproteobacteria bacterium]
MHPTIPQLRNCEIAVTCLISSLAFGRDSFDVPLKYASLALLDLKRFRQFT